MKHLPEITIEEKIKSLTDKELIEKIDEEMSIFGLTNLVAKELIFRYKSVVEKTESVKGYSTI